MEDDDVAKIGEEVAKKKEKGIDSEVSKEEL